MRDPNIDSERLAAFIDGKLGRAERQALLAQLASADDETLATFADALAVHGDLKHATPVRRPWMHWNRAAGLAAAAAVVAAVGVGYVWRASRDLGDDPTRFVDFVEGATVGSPAMRLWTTRGGGSDQRVAGEALAIRIGASITDLSLTATARDTTARAIVASIISTLGQVDGSTNAIAKYRQLEGELRAGARPREGQLRDAARSAALAAGGPATSAGAWMQAARVAAAQHDRSFFTRAANRAVLDSIAKVDLPEPAQDAVTRVRDAASDADPDWAALEGALTDLLGTLAG